MGFVKNTSRTEIEATNDKNETDNIPAEVSYDPKSSSMTSFGTLFRRFLAQAGEMARRSSSESAR